MWKTCATNIKEYENLLTAVLLGYIERNSHIIGPTSKNKGFQVKSSLDRW